MNHPRTPLNEAVRGSARWLLVVLATLAFGAADTLLQMYLIRHNITGMLGFVHYVIFILIPFGLSGMCGLLFAPMVAYPLRDVLVTKGWTRTGAAGICGLVAVVGALTAYWIVLSSWVAIGDAITRLG